MIKKIAIYDFDDTLVRTPRVESAKAGLLLAKKFGIDVPTLDEILENHYEWYDHPISLHPDIFYLEVLPGIRKYVDEDINDPETITALITHREHVLEKSVKHIIEDINGIKFDHYSIKGRSHNKIETLEVLLKEYPDVNEISVHEDSFKELVNYEKYRIANGYKSNMYFENQKYIFKLKDFITDLSNFELTHYSNISTVY